MKPVILFTIILIAICSCKKGGSNSPVPPAKDTSYLCKTEIDYTYDQTGKKLPDSNITKWAYDSKSRVVLRSDNLYNGNQIDTSISSYGSGLTTYDRVSYYNGTLSSRTHEVDFYNSQGLVDSIVESGINVFIVNGKPIANNVASNGITLYYFDAAGNDTLDLIYGVMNNIRSLGGITRKTYLNNSLSTLTSYTASGIKTFFNQWDAGNMTTFTQFDPVDGTQVFSQNFTYTNFPSGGFYAFSGNKNLPATVVQTSTLPTGNSFSETFTYAFDDANRVSTVTNQYSTSQNNQVEVYTYY